MFDTNDAHDDGHFHEIRALGLGRDELENALATANVIISMLHDALQTANAQLQEIEGDHADTDPMHGLTTSFAALTPRGCPGLVSPCLTPRVNNQLPRLDLQRVGDAKPKERHTSASEVAHLNHLLAAKDDELRSLSQRLAEADQNSISLKAGIAARDKRVEQTAASLAAVQASLDAAHAKADAKAAQLAQALAKNEAMAKELADSAAAARGRGRAMEDAAQARADALAEAARATAVANRLEAEVEVLKDLVAKKEKELEALWVSQGGAAKQMAADLAALQRDKAALDDEAHAARATIASLHSALEFANDQLRMFGEGDETAPDHDLSVSSLHEQHRALA
eukprot:TRINITY_DN13568_c0_g1_i1.p1 TRINITY_DN13568_c0_g1~~TRINITY_DN13568_c0_g1_i1.p1  ORF type:complete len:340 (+),score=140.67 TRINITY_DN13568_c0_g1_i1:78-1097(+)